MMPPKPSPPELPLWRRVAALSHSSMSSDWRSLATTSKAKMGESGHPWQTPSSMRRVRHVPSAHLWWTVRACFVEVGGKGEYFWEGICDDLEESFAGDTIGLVCQVKEDSRAGW